MRLLWLAAALTLMVQPPIDDPEQALSARAVDVSAVEVGARAPAWWLASKGGYQVRILGAPWYSTADQAWSKTGLRRRLRNASVLLLPPYLDSGAGRAPVDFNTGVQIPEAQARRLARAIQAHGLQASKFQGRGPLLAGYLLAVDYRARYGMLPERVFQEVQAEASKVSGLRTLRVPSLTVPANLKITDGLTPAAELACLEASLEEVEAGPQAMKSALAGWAGGEVRTALMAPRGLERCGFAIPGQAELRRALVTAEVAAIQDTINAQKDMIGGAGRRRDIVAVVALRTLVAENGVLDQLAARGFKIERPVDGE